MTTWQVRHQILKKHRFKISKFLNTSCKYEEWTLQIMSKKWKKQTKFGRTFKGPHTHDGFPSHSHKAGIGRRCRNEGPASQEIHIPSVIAQHPGVVTWRAIPFCIFLQSYKTTISRYLANPDDQFASFWFAKYHMDHITIITYHNGSHNVYQRWTTNIDKNRYQLSSSLDPWNRI